MTKLILALALATLATPALSQSIFIGAPTSAVDFETSGFEHPGSVRSPNGFVGGLHMAHETDGRVHAFVRAQPTVERVTLIAEPRLHSCSRISSGAQREEPCAHYRFPDGQTGPLGIADEARETFEYSVAPRLEIDVISSINFVSCMGTADACRQTRYFLVGVGE
jgi:hypothetical protein